MIQSSSSATTCYRSSFSNNRKQQKQNSFSPSLFVVLLELITLVVVLNSSTATKTITPSNYKSALRVVGNNNDDDIQQQKEENNDGLLKRWINNILVSKSTSSLQDVLQHQQQQQQRNKTKRNKNDDDTTNTIRNKNDNGGELNNALQQIGDNTSNNTEHDVRNGYNNNDDDATEAPTEYNPYVHKNNTTSDTSQDRIKTVIDTDDDDDDYFQRKKNKDDDDTVDNKEDEIIDKNLIPRIWPACMLEQYNTTADDNDDDDDDSHPNQQQQQQRQKLTIVLLTIPLKQLVGFSMNEDNFDNKNETPNFFQYNILRSNNITTTKNNDSTTSSSSHSIIQRILQKATNRFIDALKNNNNNNHCNTNSDRPSSASSFRETNKKNHTTFFQQQPLHGVIINIQTNEYILRHDIDESYEIRIPIITSSPRTSSSLTNNSNNNNKNSTTLKLFATINATTVYGAMHGLQTFRQLLEFGWYEDGQDDDNEDDDGYGCSSSSSGAIYVIQDAPITIYDAPAFPYRGLMIDTARHYIPMSMLLLNLNVMEMNKLNIFHWHITDRESWPYVSEHYPELSHYGSYNYCHDGNVSRNNHNCTYSATDIQTILQEANDRGIRVILEVDVPGHTQVIAKSHPEWMTYCGKMYGIREPLDITSDDVLEFVHTIYSELSDLYDNITTISDDDLSFISRQQQQHWMHIGGDEVHTFCWDVYYQGKLQTYMQQQNNITKVVGDSIGKQLLQIFVTDLLHFVTNQLDKRPIAWQELFDNQISGPPDKRLPLDTIIDVWKDGSWKTIKFATQTGYDLIVSYCWYLDHLNKNWMDFYDCDITRGAFKSMNNNNYNHILGGHASLWTEKVDEHNFFSTIYPKASATAENLWSGMSATQQRSSSSSENSQKNSARLRSSHQQSSLSSRTKNYKKLSSLSRLNRFRCLMMIELQIDVTPISPGGSCLEMLEQPISLVPDTAWLQGYGPPWTDP